MLAEMARQILRHFIQLEKFAHARMGQVEARVAKAQFGGIFGVLPFPHVRQRGEPVKRSHIEPQRFAHFARRRTAAIGDDIGGHG